MAQLVDLVWQAIGTIANVWVLVVLVALVLAFWYGWFVPKRKGYGDAQTFDSRVGGFRPSEAADILRAFSPEQLAVYRFQAMVVDMIFPIVYALAAAVWIRVAAPNLTELRWLILLPFAAALFDWLENICVVAVIGRFKANPDNLGTGLPTLLLIAQRMKWLLFGAILVVLAVVSAIWARRAMA